MTSLYLERGSARETSVNDLLQVAMTLPPNKRYMVEVEECRARLPDNLRARIKILVRALAKFMPDMSYEQMNEIVHDQMYPKMDKTVAGVTYTVSVPTNQLKPDEAREIEVRLFNLMGEIGCPIPARDNWTA